MYRNEIEENNKEEKITIEATRKMRKTMRKKNRERRGTDEKENRENLTIIFILIKTRNCTIYALNISNISYY